MKKYTVWSVLLIMFVLTLTALSAFSLFQFNGRASAHAAGSDAASIYPADPYDACAYDFPCSFDGVGFGANETVRLSWHYGPGIGPFKAGAAVAGSDGSFSIALAMPSFPYQTKVQLNAVGTSSKLKANTLVSELPDLFANPDGGPVGTKVHVKGGDFGSDETVTIIFQGTPLTTATTDIKGAFAANFVVPKGSHLGGTNYSIQAIGNSSGATSNTGFAVAPTVIITPKQGQPGITIRINGSNFTPTGQAIIEWYDPSKGTTTYMETVNVSSSGTFKTSIMAPSDIVAGNIYYVEGIDVASGNGGQAKFLAQ